jgi:predicted RNA-binding protein with PIN domain
VLIVDTFNVLHVTGVLPPSLAGADVDELIELIRLSRYARQRVLLVCDGAAPRSARKHVKHGGSGGLWAELPHGAGVHVVFSGAESSADERIEALLADAPKPGRPGATVVSSDRRVQSAARRAGFASLGSERFLRNLAADHERSATRSAHHAPRPAFATDLPLDRVSVGRWLLAMGVAPGLVEEVEQSVRALPSALAGQPSAKVDPVSPPTRPMHRAGKPSPAHPSKRAAPAPRGPDTALLALLREYGLSEQLASLEMDLWLERPSHERAPESSDRARPLNAAKRRGGRSRPS